MPRSNSSFLWPLRVIAAVSLVGPALVFAVASWQNYRTTDAQANERIERTLDVLQEHALKALQTIERAIAEINETLRNVPDETIRASESDLYLRFKRTQQALPQIESIWAFDKHGHPLVSSTILPVPRTLNNSDRDYFRAQAEADQGTYVGDLVRARVGTLRFFVVSGRRIGEPAGSFNGVIGVTVMPEHFNEFYRKLTRGNDSFGLVRADGKNLARVPEMRADNAATSVALLKAAAVAPDAGSYTAVSPLDGVERRVGYRKIPGFAVYVQAGVETAAIRAEFWATVLGHFALGFPAVLSIFGLSLYSIRRARRFEEESARRESAEAALKQAQRLEALGQLTGGVAHDFNNLLMVVDGNVKRIRRFSGGDERMGRPIDAIETAVKRGADLTRQLLSFSRRQTHEVTTIDLKERIPVIEEMLRSSLRGDIVIAAQGLDGVWPIRLDASEFELALLNLAVNARDAMPNGGQLTIAARNLTLSKPNTIGLDGDFVAISVQDTGGGIPADVINRVFEPFFTTKDVGKGTGLGLSQVYGFAQQTGGTATVQSTVGVGTTVTLYLPRSTETVEHLMPAEADETTPTRQQGRVLLVEDNPNVADVTRGFLEQYGYVVHTVPDVAAAQVILEKKARLVDLVLSDIVMPGGASGLDLARWILQRFGNRLPVILATGYSNRAQMAADEGYRILRKPYEAAVLNAAILEALGGLPPKEPPPSEAAHRDSAG